MVAAVDTWTAGRATREKGEEEDRAKKDEAIEVEGKRRQKPYLLQCHGEAVGIVGEEDAVRVGQRRWQGETVSEPGIEPIHL